MSKLTIQKVRWFVLTIFIIVSIFLIIINIMIFFTEIKIQVEDFKFDSQNKETNKSFKVIIKLNIFKKVNYFKFTINNDKIKSYNTKQSFDIIFKDVFKGEKNKKNLKNKKQIKIEKLNLNIDVGTENAALTAIITGIVSIIISFLIGQNVKSGNDINWNINSIYNSNLLKLELNCIISIKLIHIINRIYVTRKEGDKNARTSNRKNLKYIYEQH